jgi:saccharopine dehydrogenase (NAD+, L-lysine-forming)
MHRLQNKFPVTGVSALAIDASRPETLKPAFEKVDLVCVASGTAGDVAEIARAALACGVDYFDAQLSSPVKHEALSSLQGEIETAGRRFITDGGFHPGLPGALIRHAGSYFERLETAWVASLIQLDWREQVFSEATTDTLIGELGRCRPLVFRFGQWVEQGVAKLPTFDFGRPFGKRRCVPFFLEELRPLPGELSSLKETGHFVGGMHWFVDSFIAPIGWRLLSGSARGGKGLGSRLLGWGLKRFSKPPYGTLLLLEAGGWRGGQRRGLRIKVSHPDVHMMIAAPAVACLLQVLDGRPERPGLYSQANVVEPSRLMKDLERLGLEVEVSGDAVEAGA